MNTVTVYGGVRIRRGSRDDRKHNLPYGKWTCKDGREVLFNRFYKPLLQRTDESTAEPADPNEWVADIDKQEWFYVDDTPEREKRKSAIAVLTSWGVSA
jgi:hypothetical protein